MRLRHFIQVFSLGMIVTVSAIWMRSRITAVDLQIRLAALTARRETSHLSEQQQDRLITTLTEATLRDQADATTISAGPAITPSPVLVAPPWLLGEWRSARDWRNEGQSTPRNTVTSLLWAASGGDLNAMMRILSFDEAARQQAQTLFNTLSPAARQSFSTPEALVASMTIAAVPNNAAQISWLHQRDDNHATVGLLLSASDQIAAAEVKVVPSRENHPPIRVDSQDTRVTVLSLQRTAEGWHVVVPAAAIKRLALSAKIPAT